MNLQPHQQRVVDEKTELDAKLTKLSAFMDGQIFKALPEEERNRLIRQKEYMCDYSDVLAERIAAFSDPRGLAK